MSLSYLGNCAWEEASEPQPSTPPNDLPTIREMWIGRSDETAAFLAEKAVGASHLGGYILDNTPRDNTPFYGVGTVELIVALAPDTDDYLAVDSSSTRTASLSAEVTASGIIDGESEVVCSREVTYKAPSTEYTYFSLTRPTAPRFSAPLVSTSPEILRSVIQASANGKERRFPGAQAPAALVSALTMAVVNVGDPPNAEPIPGTPWFRCREVWSRELQGD